MRKRAAASQRLVMPDHPALRALRRGRTLQLAKHPRELRGFVRVTGCEPHGQIEDWVCPLPDGSRLHAHVMRDGKVSVHRDRWDPNRSALHRTAHVALETRAGQIGLALGFARWVGWL